MKKIIIFALALLTLCATAQNFVYMSPTNSSDANNGLTVTTPVTTLVRALTVAQGFSTNTLRCIYARAGVYTNVTCLFYGPGNGGGDDSNLEITTYPGDSQARFIGGIPITGWVATNNGMWYAPLPPYPAAQYAGANVWANWATVANGFGQNPTYWLNEPVRMMEVDGNMAQRSVYPTNPGTFLFYTNNFVTGAGANMGYTGGALNNCVASNDEIQIFSGFDSQTYTISNINTGTQIATMMTGFPWSTRQYNYSPYVYSNYLVYNDALGMSLQGQFYADRVNGLMFYTPINGKNPNSSTIYIPVTSCMLNILPGVGGSFGGLWGLVISNMSFGVCGMDFTVQSGAGYYNYSDYACIKCGSPNQAQTYRTTNAQILNCSFYNSAGNGIGADYGLNGGMLIAGCQFHHLGFSGVMMRDAPCTISNNCFHDCGLLEGAAPALRISQGAYVVGNTFSNCQVAAIGDFNVLGCTVVSNYFLKCFTNTNYVDYGTIYYGDETNNKVAWNLLSQCGTIQNRLNAVPSVFVRAGVYFDQGGNSNTCSSNIFQDVPAWVFLNGGSAYGTNTNAVVLGNLVVNVNSNLVQSPNWMARAYASTVSNAVYASNVVYTAGTNQWDGTNSYPAGLANQQNFSYSTGGFAMVSGLGNNTANPLLNNTTGPPYFFSPGTPVPFIASGLIPNPNGNGVVPGIFPPNFLISGRSTWTGRSTVQ